MLSSCERVGWAISSSASASRWRASARSRSRLPARTIRAGATSVSNRRRLVLGQRPGDHQLEPAPPRSRVGAGELGERRDQRPRVAPVAAKAPRVDERAPVRVEQAGRPPRRAGPTPGPSRSGSAAGSAIPRRRRSSAAGSRDADDDVGAPRASAARAARRAAAGRRSGTPGAATRTSTRRGRPPPTARRGAAAPAPTAWTDSGGEVVITQSKPRSRSQPQRARAGERHPGGDQRLGDEHPAQRVRPAAVGRRVEQRADGVLAGEPGAPALRVGRPDHVLGRVVGRSP